MGYSNQKPPENTRWIMSNRDLPQERELALYRVTNTDGKVREITLSKRKRQLIDALAATPLYCASPVRLSDCVSHLRKDNLIGIETLEFKEKRKSEVSLFGVYVLRDEIQWLKDLEPVKEAA